MATSRRGCFALCALAFCLAAILWKQREESLVFSSPDRVIVDKENSQREVSNYRPVYLLRPREKETPFEKANKSRLHNETHVSRSDPCWPLAEFVLVPSPGRLGNHISALAAALGLALQLGVKVAIPSVSSSQLILHLKKLTIAV